MACHYKGLARPTRADNCDDLVDWRIDDGKVEYLLTCDEIRKGRLMKLLHDDLKVFFDHDVSEVLLEKQCWQLFFYT